MTFTTEGYHSLGLGLGIDSLNFDFDRLVLNIIFVVVSID